MYTMYSNRENLPGIKPDTYEFACNPTPTAQNLFFYIDYIGHSFYDKQFAVARTSYCEYLLMYILKGKAVIQTENEKYVAAAGQAFLIETARPHVYGCVEDIECLWVHFGGVGCSELFRHLIQTNRGSHVFTLQNAANFLLQFHTLVDYFKTDAIIPEILISARLHELLALLHISSQPSERTPIDDILHYINQHYFEELTLQDLSLSDISALSNLVNLRCLRLAGNQISDIGALSNLTGLVDLDLGVNRIEDASPVANLTNLNYLGLHDNGIADLPPLQNLTNLRGLELQDNRIEDLNPLSGLGELDWLNLENNSISGIRKRERENHSVASTSL